MRDEVDCNNDDLAATRRIPSNQAATGPGRGHQHRIHRLGSLLRRPALSTAALTITKVYFTGVDYARTRLRTALVQPVVVEDTGASGCQ